MTFIIYVDKMRGQGVHPPPFTTVGTVTEPRPVNMSLLNLGTDKVTIPSVFPKSYIRNLDIILDASQSYIHYSVVEG